MTAIVAIARLDVLMLKILQDFSANGQPTSRNGKARLARIEELRGNVATKHRLAECAMPNGYVFIRVEAMDCDCSAFEYVKQVPATLSGFQDACNRIYEDAEGPTSISIVTPEFGRNYVRPRSRDLALEAFEDGHGHHISLAA